jgi:hypothetical protein
MELMEILCAFLAWMFLITSSDSKGALIAMLLLFLIFMLGLMKYWLDHEREKLRQYLHNHRDWRVECLAPNCQCKK